MQEEFSYIRGGQTYFHFDSEEYLKNRKIFVIKIVMFVVFSVVFIIGTVVITFYAYDWVHTAALSSDSVGVTVKYIKKVPDGITAADNLVSISESDLINKNSTYIFKGKIIKIQNISISFKNMKEYRAIVEIKIDKVYRGECGVGEKVKTLVPCAIGKNIWAEDSDTLLKMEEGMTGIFMPYKFKDSSVYEANGKKLTLKDIADYGFLDGSRYAFLKGKDCLIFSRTDYPSASAAEKLEDIENYILSMIQ